MLWFSKMFGFERVQIYFTEEIELKFNKFQNVTRFKNMHQKQTLMWLILRDIYFDSAFSIVFSSHSSCFYRIYKSLFSLCEFSLFFHFIFFLVQIVCVKFCHFINPLFLFVNLKNYYYCAAQVYSVVDLFKYVYQS